MKVLGSGWQYTTYDLGNGRVLKKYHSWPRGFWAVLKGLFPYTKYPPTVILDWVEDLKRKASESFEVIERKKIPKEWIGNPTRLEGLDFEQDKVIPIHKVLNKLPVSDQKDIIDAFVQFVKKLHALGVIDQNCDIGKNFGLSSTGRIVLSDLGELFDDPERIEKRLKKRTWARDHITDCFDDIEVRNYFVAEMDKLFYIKPQSQ